MNIGAWRFAPRRWAVAATLAGISLFAALGFWQLDRAAFKQDIEDRFLSRLADDYRLYDPALGLADAEYRKLEFRGEFEPAHNFLLDNQVYRGRAGYHVLTPFRIAGTDQAILVNRGWIALGASRARPPEIAPPAGGGKVAGIVNYPSRPPLLRGEFTATGWPRTIPYVDIAVLREQYDEGLLEAMLWLGPEQAGHYPREWNPLWLPPSKSRAYATQWFAFAAVCVILFIALNLKKTNE